MTVGIFYPRGRDWDNFVRSSIQHWEHFYIQWIRNRKDLLVIYFEELASRFTEITLKKITTFLNIQFNKDRLNCVLRHKEDVFKQETAFLDKNILHANPQHFRASNSCIGKEIHTFDMYTNMHVVWINSAIRNVKQELTKGGFDSSNLSKYENTNLRINICPAI